MKNLLVIRHSGDRERLKYGLDKIKKSNVDYMIVQDCYENDEFEINNEKNIYFIDKNFLFKNGLKYIEGKTGWTFGDYVLYFAKEKFNNYDYYWILDDDLYLNVNIDDFVAYYDSFDEDLIARNFGVAKDGWYWRKTLENIYPEKVYAMLYGIARFSARSVDFLKKNRLDFKSDFLIDGKLIDPNDECFSATFLANNQFKCGNLFRNDDRFNPFFNLDDPVFYDELNNSIFENKIIHPICSKSRGVDKLNNFKNKSLEKYEENLFRIFNISGKDFLLGIDSMAVNKLVYKTGGNYFFELPEIYKSFENTFLIKKWFYEKTTLVLDINYKGYTFGLDLRWDGNVDFISRNEKSKEFFDVLLKRKNLLCFGNAVKEFGVVEKYKISDDLKGRVDVLLDFLYLSIDLFSKSELLQK